jgi:hypothetical protein
MTRTESRPVFVSAHFFPGACVEENVLTMSSTTDTPEQVREGLGLEPLAPVDPIAAAEAVLADAQAAAAAAKAAEVVAEPVVAAPVSTDAPAPPVARNADGTFKPRVAPAPPVVTDPNADALSRATAAETERDALRARLEALTAAQPRAAAPPVAGAAPVAPVVTSPRLTAIAAERAALARPQQADFDDYELYEEAHDAYVAAKAELNVEERLEKKAAAAAQTQAETRATTSAAEANATYATRLTAAKLAHPDFDAVVTDEVIVSPILALTLLDTRYEHAGELAYELGANRAEAARITALDNQAQRENRAPIEAVEAIGALKAKIAARLGPGHAGARQTGPTVAAPATIRRSTAPEPTGAALGASNGAVATDLSRASDDQLKSMSQADYNRLRDRSTNTRR